MKRFLNAMPVLRAAFAAVFFLSCAVFCGEEQAPWLDGLRPEQEISPDEGLLPDERLPEEGLLPEMDPAAPEVSEAPEADVPEAAAVPRRGPVSVARLAETAERMVRRHEFAPALAYVEQALAIDPTYVPLWMTAAKAYMALNRNTEAAEALGVCLARNPHDREANLLTLVNILQWKGMPGAERTGRLAAMLRSLSAEDQDAVFSTLLARRDFPVILRPLLKAWSPHGNAMTRAKAALQLYLSNRTDEAARIASSSPGLSPAFSGALADLLDKASAEGGKALWSVERGDLEWDGSELVLIAPPSASGFAWHLLSREWKNVEMTVGLDGGGESRREIYLRYASSASFLRLVLDGGNLLVQERVPETGLVSIHEHPLSIVEGESLTLLLKGERLGLFAGGKALMDDFIAISPLIASGATVLSCDNRNGNETLRAPFAVRTAAIPERWLAAPANGGTALDKDATAIILQPRENAVAGGLAKTLITAVNQGVMTFALLPESADSLDALRSSLKGLPEVLVKRLWTGVIIPAPRNRDGAAFFSRLMADARDQGLRVAALATPESADAFPWENAEEGPGSLLCQDAGRWPASALDALAGYEGAVLYGQGAEPDVYSAVYAGF